MVRLCSYFTVVFGQSIHWKIVKLMLLFGQTKTSPPFKNNLINFHLLSAQFLLKMLR